MNRSTASHGSLSSVILDEPGADVIDELLHRKDELEPTQELRDDHVVLRVQVFAGHR
jgi:hypothetical protein